MKTNLTFKEVELLTDRLLLKRSHIDLHCKEINALICDTFDSLRPWIAWAKEKPTIEETRKALMRTVSDLRHYSFRLYLSDERKLIGVCGLVYIGSELEGKTYELGYYLHKDYVGKGYVTEAARCIINFAKESLKANRINICCMENNIASCKTAERLGFKIIEKQQTQFEMRSDWGVFTDLLYVKYIV